MKQKHAQNTVEQRAESELLKVEKELADVTTELKAIHQQIQSLGIRGGELQNKLQGLKEKKNVLHTVLGYLDGVAPAGNGPGDSTK